MEFFCPIASHVLQKLILIFCGFHISQLELGGAYLPTKLSGICTCGGQLEGRFKAAQPLIKLTHR